MKINIARIQYSAEFITHRLLVVLFFAILIIHCSREIADLDIWLHLKTGEVIVKTGHIPAYDIFSFTMSGKPWINHEWLFQLVSFLSYSVAGADGLIVMQNIVMVATFLVLFFYGLRRGHPVFVFVILYLVMLVVSYRFTIRPDIFSLFFLSLYLFILKKNKGQNGVFLWSLPVLQMIWVNMHGFSFLGPLIVLMVLVGKLLQDKLALPAKWKDAQDTDASGVARLAAIFVLMLAASLVNPHGLRGAVYPLSVLSQISQEGKVVFQYIQELSRPISWSNIFDPHRFLTYKVLILLSLFSFRVNYRRLNPSDILIWLFFLFFSLMAIRNIAYFGIAAAFITLDNFCDAWGDPASRPRLPSGKIMLVGRCLFILFLFYYPAKGAIQYLDTVGFDFTSYELKSGLWGIARDRYPQPAVRFLLAHPFPQQMFNDFNSGSYLIGQTYPRRRVFIDGRTELYGPDFFMSYVRTGEGNKDAFETLLARYPIKGFFLSNPDRDLHVGLIRFLYQSPEWTCVYFDEFACIFLRDLPENARLIRQFGIDLKNWQPPAPDFLKIGLSHRYPAPFLKRAHLLNILGCYDAAWREAQIALEIMPNNAEALRYAEDYYFYKKEYLQAFKYARLNLIYGGGQPWMRARLALIYHCMNDDPRAERVISDILRQYPDFAEGYYVQAIILKQRDPDQAIKTLRHAVLLAPKNPKYAETLGDLLAEQGNTKEAMTYWKAAYQYDAGNAKLKALVKEEKR
jgi:tetratricopeptide (TPR) repeat protein